MRLGNRIMTALEGVSIALDAIRANKVRAGLTIMGVAVGVFVVVAMTSVVRGINESFAKDIEAAGPTSFFVFRRPIGGFEACDGTDDTCPWRRNPPLTMAEMGAIQRLPTMQRVVAQIGAGGKVSYRDRTMPRVNIDAYTIGWTEVDGGDIFPGRSFTYAEAQNAARVVVINEKLAERLFADSDPMDKQVVIDGVPFTVIGIYHYTMSPMGTPTSSGSGDSPKAIIPYETARRHLNAWTRGTKFIVKPASGVALEEATDDVTATLRGMRGLKPGARNTFDIVTQDRLMGIYDKLFGTFFLVGIALSSVGLLVGGVGVVAIMMISVTERTKEIGVRKALGATRWTILWQFLVEAVTLTSLGATIGLVLGMLVAFGIRTAFPAIPAQTSVGAVVSALLMSAITGVVFGMVPAMRAAKLDPVAALRYE